jgi:hypothetical protein
LVAVQVLLVQAVVVLLLVLLTQEAHKELDIQHMAMLVAQEVADQEAAAQEAVGLEETLQEHILLETVGHHGHFRYLEQQQITQAVAVEVLQALMEAETAVLQHLGSVEALALVMEFIVTVKQGRQV